MRTEDELANLGVEWSSKTIVDTFRNCDAVISQLRKEVKTIQRWAKFLLITCVLLEVGHTCFIAFSANFKWTNDVSTLFGILFVFVLSFSVLRMRHTITSTTPAKPNDRLIAVHLVNFVVYTVI